LKELRYNFPISFEHGSVLIPPPYCIIKEFCRLLMIGRYHTD
jgi:hypothetical protein